MTTPPRKQQEFAQTLGDVQRHGDRGVLGIGPASPDAPVGLAPPPPFQVQSVFDTRPISAFDFVLNASAAFSDENPPNPPGILTLTTPQIPNGYVAVLRRVELAFYPPLIMGDVDAFLAVSLLRNGGVIPFNTLNFGVSVEFYDWPTHHVYATRDTIGLLVSPPGAFLSPGSGNYALSAMFHGTLIPSKSLPPEIEVGSAPVMVTQAQSIKGMT